VQVWRTSGSMDRLTRERRSALMSRIRGKDTAPEKTLRAALHKAGYRYRIHVRSLPGCPDIVFPTRRKAIFVHGCFWHSHEKCRLGLLPKSKLSYWKPKLQANVRRDQRNIRKLRRQGWGVLVVWQCRLRKLDRSLSRIRWFLER
jgi:DNA mismatch endonuclease (patch repair protein)